jgi:hypothetical protein
VFILNINHHAGEVLCVNKDVMFYHVGVTTCNISTTKNNGVFLTSCLLKGRLSTERRMFHVIVNICMKSNQTQNLHLRKIILYRDKVAMDLF